MARRRKRSRNRKDGNHRQAPRPDTWDSPRGFCRFCGEAIIEDGKQNNRKRWHQECADQWVIMNQPSAARKHVFARESGICQICGNSSRLMSDFHVDHIKPLFLAEGDLSYYGAENMQLLCRPCHKIKTKSDMEVYRTKKALD